MISSLYQKMCLVRNANKIFHLCVIFLIFFASSCKGGHGDEEVEAEALSARANSAQATCHELLSTDDHLLPIPGTWQSAVRGVDAFLEGPLPHAKTYARISQPNPTIEAWRKVLVEKENLLGGWRGYSLGGSQYNYTPSCFPNPCGSCGHKSKNWSGGGFFRLNKTFPVEDIPEESGEYVVRVLHESLTQNTGKTVPEILDLLHGYGISYLLYHYFDPVKAPEEGDTVIYTSPFRTVAHMGIFRRSRPNWDSPYGGTIESYWPAWSARAPNPHVFQHDTFFIPPILGIQAFFYRLRQSPRKEAICSALSLSNGPMIPEHLDKVWAHHAFPTWQEPENIWILPSHFAVHMSRAKNIDHFIAEDLEKKNPSITYLSHLRTFGVCYHHAMCLLCDTPLLPVYLTRLPYHFASFLDMFTDVVRTPLRGDLVTYFALQNIEHSLHYGIYLGEGMVESKWGEGGLYHHPIFFVPHIYGDGVQFRRVKKEFTPVTLRLFLQKISERE